MRGGFIFFVTWPVNHQVLHSFPTRRSSDLVFFFALGLVDRHLVRVEKHVERVGAFDLGAVLEEALREYRLLRGADRKSTRLNSSHSQISYAVFCLKKKIRKALSNRPIRACT